MELTEEVNIEEQIECAIKSRLSLFQNTSHSLTVKGVRRLLEKDLGFETYALDIHKKFVQHCLSECLDQVNNDNDFKTSVETIEENVSTKKGKIEDTEYKEQANKDVKESPFHDVEKTDDSPVVSLLTGKKKAKSQAKDIEDIRKGLPTESIVKDAVRKRASYLKANSSTITMAGVRKLLEEDLELEEKSLLPFKKLINEQVELVLDPPKVSKPKSSVKKASPISSRGKPTRNESSKESADSLDGESEEDVKTKKIAAARRKVSEEPKKRKAPASVTKASSKKRLKEAEDNSDAEAGGESEDDQSLSSDEKPAKRKEIATPSYGKRVEQLKSIIKSCGMSVPPVVYKKAKQVSEDKREAFLRKELEEILSREGLSANPSEKEIKDCKKRKATAKELEGIDMSNIVSSSRRRSTTSFIPPPKPKITAEKKDDDAEEGGSDEEGDSEDESDGDSDSQSEEVIEDADDEDNSD